MDLSPLTAISPIDGRYQAKCSSLMPLMSEYGLIKHRVIVEVEFFMALAATKNFKALPKLSKDASQFLRQLLANFSLEDAKQVKSIEADTNHDVKAVEYFLKKRFSEHAELKPYIEFIHFACTSEDINNLAYALMLRNSRQQVLLPLMDHIRQKLAEFAHNYQALPMMSRTHGQPATPTTLGKEFANVLARLNRAQHQFANVEIMGKLNGAVGNYNAHQVSCPEVNWPKFSEKFCSEQLELSWAEYTTQIEPHDYIAEYCDALARFNRIAIDFCRDSWGYISLGYFSQRLVSNEVGSSTMPHKVNPIDFENAEGNFGIANALLEHFARALPISRWQRDLTDSTLLRNLGSAAGYTVIACQALLKGLSKISANPSVLTGDLEQNWELLAEPIQTVMRLHGIDSPYERLKALTRGKKLTAQDVQSFIEQLDIPDDDKKRLLALTPMTYLGNAVTMAQKLSND